MLISLHGTLKIRNLADIKTWARAFTRLTCRPMERRFSNLRPYLGLIGHSTRMKHSFGLRPIFGRRFGEPTFHSTAGLSGTGALRPI